MSPDLSSDSRGESQPHINHEGLQATTRHDTQPEQWSSTFQTAFIVNTFVAVVVQLLSRVQLFVTPWTVALQASLSFTVSWSLVKLISIQSVMLSNHLTLCHPLLLLPSIFPHIGVFSSESAPCIRWPKY